MPELLATITNKVLKKGEIEKLTGVLELPAKKEQIAQLLRELRVEGAGENGRVEVEWMGTNYPPLYTLEIACSDINRIYELNHLAERIAALDESGRIKLTAMCYKYLDEMEFYHSQSTDYEPTIAHAINLTHNLDGIQVIEGISDKRQLGYYCVQHRIPGYEDLHDVKREYLNYDRIGEEYSARLGGCFYSGSFVYNLPAHADMKILYDGASLLIEPPPNREQAEEQMQKDEVTMGGM